MVFSVLEVILLIAVFLIAVFLYGIFKNTSETAEKLLEQNELLKQLLNKK